MDINDDLNDLNDRKLNDYERISRLYDQIHQDIDNNYLPILKHDNFGDFICFIKNFKPIGMPHCNPDLPKPKFNKTFDDYLHRYENIKTFK
jgi:hypothetical protein